MDEKPTAAAAKKLTELQSAEQFSGSTVLNTIILRAQIQGRG
jgi:hypothetical protein